MHVGNQGMRPADWAELEYFGPHEFDRPELMSPLLLRMLDEVREAAGCAIFVTSSYRAGDTGAHGLGLAVDISDDEHSDGITSRFRYRVIQAAMRIGFSRIGVYDKHIHLDISGALPQNVLWIGESS